MRTGRLRTWAGLGAVALLFVPCVLQAQDGSELRQPPAPISGPGVVAAASEAPPLPSSPVPVSVGAVAEPMAPATLPDAHAPEGHAPEGHAVDGHVNWDAHEPPCCEGRQGCGAGVWGEYLLMHARRNALDYSILNNNNATQIPGGTIETADWKTDAGLRVGAEWALPNTCWQANLTYTYFHSGDSRGLNAPANGSLFADLPRAGTVDQVNSAFTATNINYQVVDFDLARKVKVADDFVFTIFGGVRFADIDQGFGALYNGGGATNYLVNSPVNFRGAGLTMGGDGFWNLYRGAGVYARGRFSLLSGYFNNSEFEVNNAGAPGALLVVGVTEKQYDVIPVTELGMGVGYRSEHMMFSVGYELSNWFNMVNSPDFVDPTSAGKLVRRTSDLMLEALSVQLGFMY